MPCWFGNPTRNVSQISVGIDLDIDHGKCFPDCMEVLLQVQGERGHNGVGWTPSTLSADATEQTSDC